MEKYVLYRIDEDTGEDIEIPLEVEVDSFSPGIPTKRRDCDMYEPAYIELGTIRRIDTGEIFEPTKEELEEMESDLWDSLAQGLEEDFYDDGR